MDNNEQLRSISDAAAILAAAEPEDRADLTRVRDWLTALVELELYAGEVTDRARAARDALSRVLLGEAMDSQVVLSGAGEALEQAARMAEGSQAGEAAQDEAPEAAGAPSGGQSSESPGGEVPPTLPEDLDDELLAEYIAESLDHITAAEGALLDLEVNPGSAEAINTVFRAFHTIKGTSGFLGLDKCHEMAHKAENILHRAREGEIRLTGGYADLALESCDVLKAMIQALNGIHPGDPLNIPESFAPLLARLINPDEAGVSAEVPEAVPRIGDLLVAEGKANRDEIEQAALSAEKSEVPIGQAIVDSGVASAADVAKTLRVQKQMGKPCVSEASIRVGTDRLDKLINMVGELVIAQSMVSQDPDVLDGSRPRLTKSVSHASKIVRELQDLTMALRMVPLKGTFQKMARLVRDLGRKSGKSVQFMPEGEETEIDRNMVEVLNDPLVHMIRNSLDHGLESPQERVKAGKPEAGTVRLRAYQTAGNVIIELADDGKGLDREKILAKAIDRGLLGPDSNPTDGEVFGLIFHAGFSTADKITDVSGRGVGMDVVKKSIDSLRGRIQVSSGKGVGSTFTLHLPLTLAITDAMVVQVGSERYLLPTVSIEQSFRPEPGAVSTVTGRGEMVLLRGDLIPIVRLNQLLGVEDAITDFSKALLMAVEAEGKRCALMVDELLGQQQVVVKSLGEGMGEIPGVSGGTILGDGRVGLILDVAGLLKMAHAGTAFAASGAVESIAAERQVDAEKQAGTKQEPTAADRSEPQEVSLDAA